MLMLMVANGLLVTLLTIRGSTLGFSQLAILIMQVGYPVGALAGMILTPRLIEKVGHIRMLSALASILLSVGDERRGGGAIPGGMDFRPDRPALCGYGAGRVVDALR
jgi:hypothetical protein